MTEFQIPTGRWRPAGIGLADEEPRPFVARCSVFKDRRARVAGLAASNTSLRHEKGPS